MKMPNCINCNTNLNESEKFCPICGQIQTSETKENEPEIATPEVAEPVAPIQPPQASYQQPPQGAYPPPQGAYPPTQGAYPPPQGAYPPPQGAYPPPQGAYPPPQGAYPPPQGAYPPPQGAYPPPPQSGYYQPYAQPYYPPPVLNGNAGAMLVWGIINIVLSVFCCFLLNLVPAIIAVVFANKAKSSLNQVDYDKAAKTALILNIVSSALTVVAIIIFIVLAATGNMHFNTYGNVT